MSASRTRRARPWLIVPAAVLAVAVVAEAALLVWQGRAAELAERRRVQWSTMAQVAEEFRALKAGMAARRGGVAKPGALDIKRIEQIARSAGITSGVNSTIPPVRADGDAVERIIDLTVARVRRQDLSTFLLRVEAIDPAVRTKELLVTEARGKTTVKGKSFVDAKVRLSAYESIRPETK